jgi:hypothetical protein
LKDYDRRILSDRRKQPTQALSRYTFFGRRRKFRRKTDQERGGYTDRYSAGLFFVLILIVGLNILDAFFTMIILDHGGWEVNPIVGCVIQLYGDKFWVWKFVIVSISLILLCLHINFGRARTLINAVGFIYIAVVVYQIFLLNFRLPEIP